MSIPSYASFIEPVLVALARNPDGMRVRSVNDAVAQSMALSAADRRVMLESGKQPTFENRISWAHDRLRRHGYSSSPRRGFWRLTGVGLALARSRPHEHELAALATTGPSVARVISVTPAAIDQPAPVSSTLGTLRTMSPSEFEYMVAKLLLAMGYGARESDVEVLGGGGDEGIDGVVFLDPLRLHRLYFQAKRWRQNVGRPEVQGFVGALIGRRATEGVLFSTSEFTTNAVTFARDVSPRVVLVGAERLDALMREFLVDRYDDAFRVKAAT